MSTDSISVTMNRFRVVPRSFYSRTADHVAPALLGRYLVRELGGQRLVLRIVETEAYLGAPDRASHAWGGRRTPRNRVLYEPGGVAYVYFIYGMYHCLNAVTGERGSGDAVLIRAGEPIAGLEQMARHRRRQRSAHPGEIAGGPGKLCMALAVDRTFDGHPLQQGSLRITCGEPVAADQVVMGPRIGIDYAGAAASWPLRYAIAGNQHVSRPHLRGRESGHNR